MASESGQILSEGQGKLKATKKSDFFGGFKSLKNEYKKIAWLDFKSLCKQTCDVIAVCIFFGFVIFAIDAGFGYCMNYLISSLSK